MQFGLGLSPTMASVRGLFAAFEPIGFIEGSVLMNAAHSHHPFPFAPAGLIPGAVLMDASGA